MKDFEIRCDESRLETTNLIYGKFTLGPFLPGQATTFGNALRRSLLAELSGLAITAFEIIGVMQEFSTLPGLRESILDLSLNLKQIVLTGVLPHSTPPIGFLNVRGPAIIKAIDIKLPAGVYCASPNQYIATLGSSGMLHLKFVVSIGKGYSIQPYSIYRSLSKVKLQPASNFDNTTNQRRGINYARQVGYESFKDVNLSSTPIPLEGKGYNKETPGFVKPVKEFYVQSKEGQLREQKSPTNFSASSYRDSINSLNGSAANSLGKANEKTKKEESLRTDKTKSNEGLSYNKEHTSATHVEGSGERTNFQTFNSNSVLTSRNNKDPLISFTCKANDFPPYVQSKAIPQRGKGSWQSKEGLGGQEQALSYKASPSTFFTNEKKSAANPLACVAEASSYVNIQTQLFQRINPHQVLPIDAVFTPVSQVNFLTEVNDRFETARENIVLEIWTNGSIHPKRALEEATLSLVQNFDTLLKKIQQASSFYKGLRYWTYLQPFKSWEKTDGFSVNSLLPDVQNKASDNWQSTLPAAQALQGQDQKSSPVSELTEDFVYSSNKDLLTPYPDRACVAEGYAKQEEELLEKLFKKDLPQSIYNLDIGNLNLSLQTFIFLKKAKIHTLLQLLTQFSLKENNIPLNDCAIPPIIAKVNPHLESNLLNEKIMEELNDVIRQFGSED